MRKIVRIIALSTALLGLSTTAVPQMQPGMIDFTPSMNARVANMNSDLAMSEYNRRAAIAAERRRIEQAGAAKIKAGKATTSFTATAAGTQALVKTLTFEAHVPKDFSGQVRFVQGYIDIFNKLAKQNGISVNDYADGTAFAQALAYSAYHDRDMDKSEFERLRKSYRDYLLKDASFQGLNDEDRQFTYELHAILSAQAAEQRVNARRATNNAERQKYVDKAKYFAAMLLDMSNEK